MLYEVITFRAFSAFRTLGSGCAFGALRTFASGRALRAWLAGGLGGGLCLLGLGFGTGRLVTLAAAGVGTAAVAAALTVVTSLSGSRLCGCLGSGRPRCRPLESYNFV